MQLPNTPPPSQQTYLILGAGVFGSSTALHLKRSYPGARVILLDRAAFPNPAAASYDHSKIVRADYSALIYMPLAIQALRLWAHDPLFKPWFHPTGMIWLDQQGVGREAYDNYRKLGHNAEAEMLTPAQARTRWPMFPEEIYEDVEEMLWSPHAGWCEADRALGAVIQAAIDIGVEYVQADVARLIFDNKIHSVCVGAETRDGQRWHAHNTILCVGAYTEKLLADSAPHRPELHANGRVFAAGAITCILDVPERRRAEFAGAPPLINDTKKTSGDYIGLSPRGEMKFNSCASFTHYTQIPSLEYPISLPPSGPSGSSTWTHADVPRGLKTDILAVARGCFGAAATADLTRDPRAFRMCWDSITPSQDFILAPHGGCENLVVACGGSFHAWKFFPLLGALVTQVLAGTLDAKLAAMWAWDRKGSGGGDGRDGHDGDGDKGGNDDDDDDACGEYMPKRDLKDVEGYEEWHKGREQAA